MRKIVTDWQRPVRFSTSNDNFDQLVKLSEQKSQTLSATLREAVERYLEVSVQS